MSHQTSLVRTPAPALLCGLVLSLCFGFTVPQPVHGQATTEASEATVGEVSTVRNDVRGTPAGGASSPLSVGDGLFLAHRIETGVDSGTHLRLGEDGRLSLGSETQITLDEATLARAAPRPSRLSLLVGSLRLRIGDLLGDELTVETPTAVIGIKGTDLRVYVYPDGLTVVTVFEGLVTVASATLGDLVEVAAGQRTTVAPSASPTAPEPVDTGGQTDPTEETTSGEAGQTEDTPDPDEGGSDSRSDSGEDRSREDRDSRRTDRPDRIATGPPALTGCSARARIGYTLCVCGNFPNRRAASGLTLGGKPLGEPTFYSPNVAWYKLSSTFDPGRRPVRGKRRAGFDRGARCDVNLYSIDIDDKSRRKLRLTLQGTDEVSVQVSNLSPGKVHLVGGDIQWLTLREKKPEIVKITGGTFLSHALLLTTRAQCPCAGDVPDPSSDPEVLE